MLKDVFKKKTLPPEAKPAPKIVITVDGPAASGKGTLAKALAAHLGYAYLDTGALYRVIALSTLEAGGDPAKYEDVQPSLEIFKSGLDPALLTNPALRRPEVAEAASKVSAIPDVRTIVRDYQNVFAENPPGDAPGVVLDGRDIGTVVYPDADIKFFVTASPEERARRRFEELKNSDPDLTLEAVLQDVNDRDQRDMSRTTSPLRTAEDAYVLDTTTLNPAEVLKEALDIISSKFLPKSHDNVPSSKKPFTP